MLPRCKQVYILQYVKWETKFQSLSSFISHSKCSGFSLFTSDHSDNKTALIMSQSEFPHVMIVSSCQISFLLLV